MAIVNDLIVRSVSRFLGKIYAPGGIVGDLTGTADKAKQDASGNTITSYYEPKSNVTSKGSASQPVFFDANGVAQPTTYTLGATVPSGAKFTDTVTTVVDSGAGDVITDLSATNGVITATKGNLTYDNIQPIISRSYSGLLCSSNTNGNGADFMPISVTPEANKLWRIKYRVRTQWTRTNNNVVYSSDTVCEVIAYANASGTYACWNHHRDGSYRGHYYMIRYRPTTATADNILGFSMYNCNNNVNAGNERTTIVDILEYDNCTVVLRDTCANTDYTTYYKNMNGRDTYDAANNGLQEVGDANNYDRTLINNGFFSNGSTFRNPPYSLLLFTPDFKANGISLYQSEYTGSTQSLSTTRVYNTETGFDISKDIWYKSSGTNHAKDALIDVSPYSDIGGVDWRYNDNCVYSYNRNNFGFEQRKEIYLRGVIIDGLFYLRPYEATQVIVQGYKKDSIFVTASGGTTNISNYTALSSNYIYQDITTGKYYTYANSTYTETTDYSAKPKYQKVWTQDIPTSAEFDADGNQYVYWCLGMSYYSSNYRDGGYQYDLYQTNKVYWFKDGRFREYSENASAASGSKIKFFNYTSTFSVPPVISTTVTPDEILNWVNDGYIVYARETRFNMITPYYDSSSTRISFFSTIIGDTETESYILTATKTNGIWSWTDEFINTLSVPWPTDNSKKQALVYNPSTYSIDYEPIPSSEGQIIRLTGTPKTTDQTHFTENYTYNDIKKYIDAGKEVIFIVEGNIFRLVTYNSSIIQFSYFNSLYMAEYYVEFYANGALGGHSYSKEVIPYLTLGTLPKYNGGVR